MRKFQMDSYAYLREKIGCKEGLIKGSVGEMLLHKSFQREILCVLLYLEKLAVISLKKTGLEY